MAEPELSQVFGNSASQDAVLLTIDKADLPLTASAANTAEGLFVAIVLKAKEYLNPNTVNPDIQIQIEEGFESLTLIGETQYRQRQLTINLLQPDESTPLSADDY
jgi:hypothetical protein